MPYPYSHNCERCIYKQRVGYRIDIPRQPCEHDCEEGMRIYRNIEDMQR